MILVDNDAICAEAERLKDEDAFSQTVIAEQGRKIDDLPEADKEKSE